MLDTSFTPPLYGMPSLQFTPPFIHWLPCASVCFGDITMLYRDYFPYVEGFGGTSAHGVSMCLFLYILVVHYVSCFHYGYDYYSSSYSGVFWSVICFISDHGSFLDGASCNTGVVWSGTTTTLDAKRLWRCYWPCLCATAAISIFDASSGLCQLCYGFSTSRFLFQS